MSARTCLLLVVAVVGGFGCPETTPPVVAEVWSPGMKRPSSHEVRRGLWTIAR